MRTIAMMALMIMGAGGAGSLGTARTLESTTVNVPFDFAVKDQKLAAGTYRVVLATQARPEKDELEVVVFEGVDTPGFAAIVATVGGDGPESGIIFKQAQGRAKLREIHMLGKHLSIGPVMEEDRRAGEGTEEEEFLVIGEHAPVEPTVTRILEEEPATNG